MRLFWFEQPMGRRNGSNPRPELKRAARGQRSRADHLQFRPRLEPLEDRLAPAVEIWTGLAGDGNWATAGNWATNVAPVNGDSLVFPTISNQAAINPVTNNFATNMTFASITFGGPATTNGYNILGNGFTVTNGITSATAGANEAFNCGTITVAGSQTWISDGLTGTFGGTTGTAPTITFNSALDLGSSTLTIDGSSNFQFNVPIAGFGGSIIKNGPGFAALTGANTYGGTTTINNGILEAQNSQAFGTNLASSVSINSTAAASGTLSVTNGVVLPQNIQVSGIGFAGRGALLVRNGQTTGTFNGNITLLGNTSINAEQNTMVINGVIQGAFNLTKLGVGTVNLQSAESYSGTTTIDGGILQFTSNGTALNSTSFLVQAEGQLRFDMTNVAFPVPRISTTAPITLNGGGIFISGRSTAGAPELLLNLGALTLAANTEDYILQNGTANVATLTVFANLIQNTDSTLAFQTNAAVPLGTAPATVTGASGNRIVFTNASALALTPNNPLPNAPPTGIVPWAMLWTNNVANVFDLVTYSPVVGATGNVTGITAVPAANYGAGYAAGNNDITGGTAPTTGTVNALLVSGTNTAAAPANITVTTGDVEARDNGADVLNLLGGTLNLGTTGYISDGGGTAAGSLTILGAVTTTGDLIVNGNGGLPNTAGVVSPIIFGGAADTTNNAIGGTTYVEFGTLQLAKPAGFLGLNGNVVIGGDVGGRQQAALQLNASNELAATANVTVNNDGLFSLQTFAQTINNLTLNSGNLSPLVFLNTGSILTLNGNLTVNNVAPDTTQPLVDNGVDGYNPTRATYIGASNTVANNGTLFLSAGSHTFNINRAGAPGGIEYDALIVAFIAGSGSIVKTGTGNVQFTNVESYTGTTTVQAGALAVDNTVANSDFTVASGGTLDGTSSLRSLVVQSGGTVNPGETDTPERPANHGTLTVNTFVNLQAGSNLILQVAGINNNSPGTDYDRLVQNIAGQNLTLGGTLTVDLLGLGQAGTIGVSQASSPLDYLGNLVGTFSNLLPGGFLPASSILNNPLGFQVRVIFNGASNGYMTLIISRPPVVPLQMFAVNNGVPLTQAAPGLLTGATEPDFGSTVSAVAMTYTGSAGGTLVVAANGSFTYTPPTTAFTGADVFAAVLFQNTLGFQTSVAETFNDVGVPPPPPPPPPAPAAAAVNAAANAAANNLLGGARIYAVGAAAGQPPLVNVYNAQTNALITTLLPFPVSFTGGVRVAVGDVNGDGIPDIIVGAGPGALPQVTVYNGSTFQAFDSFYAFSLSSLQGINTTNSASIAATIGNSFVGGVFVAAGDITGAGHADIIVGADAGGGPQVEVFDGVSGALLRSFFALPTTFTGGVRVAAGDVNGDGLADLICTAGPGGGPQVSIYSGADLGLIASFYGYSPSFEGGVFPAAGDVNGDGRADIVLGPGAGGGPQIAVFSGATFSPIGNFYAYGSGFTGGVRVGTATGGNGRINIYTVPGKASEPQVEIFDGLSLAALGTFFAYPSNFNSGLFIT